MSEQTYLVPRQVTTRFEFVPGWGMREAIGIVAGVAGSYLVYQVTAKLGLPSQPRVVLTTLPAVAAIGLAKGWDDLTRWLVFLSGQQRFFYRVGTGRSARPQVPASLKGVNSPMLAALLSLVAPKKSNSGGKPGPAQTAQDWLPVADIQGGMIRRKDGHLVAAIRVEPLNWSLKSPAEQGRIISGLHEAVNGLQHPAQVLSLPRPLDLDAYVRGLEGRLREVDQRRQQLLRPYIRYVAGLVAGGEAQERRHYVLLPQNAGKAGADELRQRGADLVSRLAQAGLQSHALEDAELMDLLHVWSHPAQAAFERAPGGPPNVTSLLEV